MIDTKMVFIVDVYVKMPVIKRNMLFKRMVFPTIKLSSDAAFLVMSSLQKSALEDIRKNNKLSGLEFYAKCNPGFVVSEEEFVTGTKAASIILEAVNNLCKSFC